MKKFILSNNYLLNSNSSQKTIDLSSYQSGHYIVTLVCDGQMAESKNLIKINPYEKFYNTILTVSRAFV